MEKSILLAAAAGIVLTASCAVSADGPSIPPPAAAETDMLVGAYYFPGWSQEHRWYCIAASDEAQHPLLGYYREGDPDAADWHIKWALENGVSFFAFDYYTVGGGQMLEAALDEGFLKCRFIDRFKFCLNWCSHGPASEMTAEELDEFGDLVIRKYLTHPSYLRIDNKPVVMMLAGAGFAANLGVSEAREAFARFEEKCRGAGLDGVYLVFCEGHISGPEMVSRCKALGVDAFCLYNYPYAGSGLTGPTEHKEMSYEHLIQQGKQLWEHWRTITNGDFWPTVMPGWDRRPWTKDKDLIRTGSTPELFGRSLSEAREYVSSDRIVMIEAWNEWGEGSVLEPSVEHGFAYLDQVRKTFCINASAPDNTDPKSLGMRQPVFDLRLPSEDTWRFDYDAMGWTAANMKGLHSTWGVLSAVSTTDDPQLTSPITYLDCGDYPRFRLRMRAAPLGNAPEKVQAQLFWATVHSGLCEENSVRFDVYPDSEWHVYEVDLASCPNWKGRTDRFRLDPVPLSDISVEIDEIRFLKASGK